MANFSESLTIRILGDSSHLQRELDAVRRRIEGLDRQFGRFDEINSRLEQTGARIGGLSRPLLGVSRLFDRVAAQAEGLGQIPITLNVAPAIAALNTLLGFINLVAARLAALSIGPMMGGFGGVSVAAGRAIPRLSEGGVVRGPAGRDRVPSFLSAGEFVLREPVVAKLGVGFLNALNEGLDPRGRSDRAAPMEASSARSTQVNNFGGIAIHVSRPAEVNTLVRDLRLQGFRLRNRRG